MDKLLFKHRIVPAVLTTALLVGLLVSPVAAQEGPKTHIVQEGETISGIAELYGITVDALLAVNSMEDPEAIVAGMELTIPAAEEPSEEKPSDAAAPATTPIGGQGGGADQTYVVQIADTLDTIAQEYDVAMLSIAYANELDAPYVIMPGQTLVIPGDAPPYGVIPPLPNQTVGLLDGQGGGGAGETYTVQIADTLDTIAQEYDVAMLSIAYANELDAPYVIMPGQTLVIPGDAPPYGVIPPLPNQPAGLLDGQGGGGADETYSVQIADTLDTIAQAYDIAMLSIAYANELEAPYVIMPGQTLVIPGDAPPYGVIPPLPDQTAGLLDGQGGGGAGETYTVQIADTLDTIAQEYDVAMLSIAYANGLEAPYVIMPGQTLVIPGDAPPYGVIPPLPGQAVQPAATSDGQGGGGKDG